jgi:myosin-crossreactive antigen
MNSANGDMAADKKAYLVSGGIGSLAAAAFMIRDGGRLRSLGQLPLFNRCRNEPNHWAS